MVFRQWAVISWQLAVGSQHLKIHPNPNDGVFTIEVSESVNSINDHYTISFYNTFGEKVHEEKMNESVQSFDVDLPSGIYYCCVLGENNLRGLGKMCVID